jgi:hypothetical protein
MSLGTFDPTIETRPSTSTAYTTNLRSNPSFESSSPLPTANSDYDIVRNSTHTYHGSQALRCTIDEANSGSGAWLTTTVTATSAMGSSGVFVSYRVYLPSGHAFIGDQLETNIQSSSHAGATIVSSATLVQGWNLITATRSATHITAGDTVTINFCVADVGMTSGETGDQLWVDDVLIKAGTTSADWEPYAGDNFYTEGQEWTVTGTGTFQGLSVSFGDTLRCTSSDYLTYTSATWEVIEQVGDLEGALTTAPADSVGAPTGYGDWRWGLQALLPVDSSALWGFGIWGTSTWAGSLRWYDLTPYVRGCTWQRGAFEFDGRPEVGVAQVTLDNSDYLFSPVDPTNSFEAMVQAASAGGEVFNNYFGPGTVMRIVAHSPTDYGPVGGGAPAAGGSPVGWVPQFTGVVESWAETRNQLDQESYVEVTFIETLSRLARVDELALSSNVGDDDSVVNRIDRLATTADWPFGYDLPTQIGYDTVSGDYLLQSTDMANNRLGEVYLTGDSVGATIRTGRDGRITSTEGIVTTGTSYEVSDTFSTSVPVSDVEFYAVDLPGASDSNAVFIDPDGITWDNDDSPVENYVQYARAGGTEQTAEDTASISRYGRRSVGRSDLLNKSDTLTGYLAADRVARRANTTLRLRSAEVDGFADDDAVGALISIDHGASVVVYEGTSDGGSTATTARVDNLTHYVLPSSNDGPCVWRATYGFGKQTAPTYSPPS